MELATRPVTVEEFVCYREQGFLVVRGLLAQPTFTAHALR
jgi:hypothetical protein